MLWSISWGSQSTTVKMNRETGATYNSTLMLKRLMRLLFVGGIKLSRDDYLWLTSVLCSYNATYNEEFKFTERKLHIKF